jgi:hypothetical protein
MGSNRRDEKLLVLLMKIIHFISLGDDDTEGFVTPEGKVLGAWHPNDATWRNEYFRGFMSELGIEVKIGRAGMKASAFNVACRALRALYG